MSIHWLAIDTDPHFPLPEGQFGGWLKNRDGYRITLSNAEDETFRIGIFNAGKWNIDPLWSEAWIEFKAMVTGPTGNSEAPTSNEAAVLTATGAAVDSVATKITFDDGSAAHAEITYTSAVMALITSPGTYWMIVTVQDGSGTDQATCAAGRVTITA